MFKKHLNHSVRTLIPVEFIKYDLLDVSSNNDVKGSLQHPKIDRFCIYPISFNEINNEWEIYDFDSNDCIGIKSTSQVIDFINYNLSILA